MESETLTQITNNIDNTKTPITDDEIRQIIYPKPSSPLDIITKTDPLEYEFPLKLNNDDYTTALNFFLRICQLLSRLTSPSQIIKIDGGFLPWFKRELNRCGAGDGYLLDCVALAMMGREESLLSAIVREVAQSTQNMHLRNSLFVTTCSTIQLRSARRIIEFRKSADEKLKERMRSHLKLFIKPIQDTLNSTWLKFKNNYDKIDCMAFNDIFLGENVTFFAEYDKEKETLFVGVQFPKTIEINALIMFYIDSNGTFYPGDGIITGENRRGISRAWLVAVENIFIGLSEIIGIIDVYNNNCKKVYDEYTKKSNLDSAQTSQNNH